MIPIFLLEKLKFREGKYKANGRARSVSVVFFSFCCIMVTFFFLSPFSQVSRNTLFSLWGQVPCR